MSLWSERPSLVPFLTTCEPASVLPGRREEASTIPFWGDNLEARGP